MLNIQPNLLRSSRNSSTRKTATADKMSYFSASNINTIAPFTMALDDTAVQLDVHRKPTNLQPTEPGEAIIMVRYEDLAASDEESTNHYFHVPFDADRRSMALARKPKEEGKKFEPQEQQRRNSVAEANRFLEAFIEARWEAQMQAGYVKIHCDLTMDQLKELGRLSQPEGSTECRKLISAPVIHDAIGYALWSDMAQAILDGGEDQESVAEAGTTRSTSNNGSRSEKQNTERQASITWTSEQEVTSRRARSMRRRATENDVVSKPRSRSAYSVTPTSTRTRRKSDMPMVRPDQVMCTTCGSRAMPTYNSEEENEEAMEDEDEVPEEVVVRKRKRDSIPRRLSYKMNKTLSKFGEGLAGGYGGHRVVS
ncbi:hypothetical protein EsH8_II_001527 [Colletotrichum jinshuiense]